MSWFKAFTDILYLVLVHPEIDNHDFLSKFQVDQIFIFL